MRISASTTSFGLIALSFGGIANAAFSSRTAAGLASTKLQASRSTSAPQTQAALPEAVLQALAQGVQNRRTSPSQRGHAQSAPKLLLPRVPPIRKAPISAELPKTITAALKPRPPSTPPPAAAAAYTAAESSLLTTATFAALPHTKAVTSDPAGKSKPVTATTPNYSEPVTNQVSTRPLLGNSKAPSAPRQEKGTPSSAPNKTAREENVPSFLTSTGSKRWRSEPMTTPSLPKPTTIGATQTSVDRSSHSANGATAASQRNPLGSPGADTPTAPTSARVYKAAHPGLSTPVAKTPKYVVPVGTKPMPPRMSHPAAPLSTTPIKSRATQTRVAQAGISKQKRLARSMPNVPPISGTKHPNTARHLVERPHGSVVTQQGPLVDERDRRWSPTSPAAVDRGVTPKDTPRRPKNRGQLPPPLADVDRMAKARRAGGAVTINFR